MKVGDYVRTKVYGIRKVLKIGEFMGELEYKVDEEKGYWALPVNIIKSSPNIIDLIEVGDIIKKTYKTGLIEKIPINKIEDIEHIKLDLKDGFKLTIVTHEQFSQMEYEIGE